MTNGRRKGAAAELQVAKSIEFWWQRLPLKHQSTPDGMPAEFVRTPQSGGWSTKRVRGTFRVAGDLSSTSNSWPFAVEVKRREAWSLTMFVSGSKRGSPVWSWWAQCVKSADEEGGVPMLWMRRSKQPWLVLLPESIAVPRLGVRRADIFWEDPSLVAKHNRTNVHPIGYLATKILDTDPCDWLGLRRSLAPPVTLPPPGV